MLEALSRGRAGRSQAGFTVIEMAVTLASMTVVLGGSMTLLVSSRGAWQVGGTRSSLQEVGRRILNEVVADIRRSGLTVEDGQGYPAIYQRPPEPLGAGERPAEPSVRMDPEDVRVVDLDVLVGGDPGSSSSRIERNRGRTPQEFVFQLPADLDGDGRPLDGNGDLEWSGALHSFRIVVESNGVPWLYHLIEEGGAPARFERVGPHVTGITFDVVANDRSLGFNEVAVVVYLQRLNERGQRITAALESSVVLRNTREL
jgi:hypothetical protein